MSFPENIKDSYKSREIMREFEGSSRIVSPTYAQTRTLVYGLASANEVDCANMHVHCFAAPDTQSFAWNTLSGGANGSVAAVLAVLGSSNVFVGGYFTNANGVANTSRIARWDGTSWNAMGTGMNGDVWSLGRDGAGNIYAGGAFTLAGGVASTARIARWTGAAWQALGTGIPDGGVNAIVAQGTNMIVGGSFTSAGGVASTAKVARWTGAVWQSMNSATVNGDVRALTVDDSGVLYAGTSTGYVYRWDGSAWQTVTIVGGSVYALATTGTYPNTRLYIGGSFTATGASPSITMYQLGGGFIPMGAGAQAPVAALFRDSRGGIWAGGSFSDMDGVANTSRAARWNGYVWTSVGTGFTTQVNAFSQNSSEAVFVGGIFSSAGGTTVSNIASATPIANTTGITLKNMKEGQSISISIASRPWSYSMTWASDDGSPIRWPQTGSPTPTAVANAYDVYTFLKVGGAIYGSYLLRMS